MRNPITGEYEGFCIDLLKSLSDMMEFTYTLYEVGDGTLELKMTIIHGMASLEKLHNRSVTLIRDVRIILARKV